MILKVFLKFWDSAVLKIFPKISIFCDPKNLCAWSKLHKNLLTWNLTVHFHRQVSVSCRECENSKHIASFIRKAAKLPKIGLQWSQNSSYSNWKQLDIRNKENWVLAFFFLRSNLECWENFGAQLLWMFVHIHGSPKCVCITFSACSWANSSLIWVSSSFLFFARDLFFATKSWKRKQRV